MEEDLYPRFISISNDYGAVFLSRLFSLQRTSPGRISQAFVAFSLLAINFFFTSGAYATDPPFILPNASELNKLKSATITTNKGKLSFELFPEETPWHVANFKYLADKGFYQNLSFTQFYPNYIIQGGEPRGASGPGYSLAPEFGRRKHIEGALGMARRQDFMNPERRSNGSQFHILLAPAPHMDGSYTIFGQLIGGFDVLQKLRQGDRILNVTVYVRKGASSSRGR